MRVSVGILAATAFLGGCWKLNPAELPAGRVAFAPAAGGPAGWVIEEFPVDVMCPDGDNASIYVVYPEVATGSLPVAVLYPSGAFDYVIAPPPTDPLSGAHHQDPPRLNRDWAVRRVYATLGMFEEVYPLEANLGALPAAFANANIAMIVPMNCWGDLGHNAQTTAENDFATERFYRQGYTVNDLAWHIATDAGVATANGVSLPFTFDSSRLYLVGLGEGGRAVGESLFAGAPAAGVLVDSTVDDLRPYYASSTLYADTIVGLNRIFPGGAETTVSASLATVTNLPPTAFLYSSIDGQLPAGANTPILTRLGGRTGDYIYDAAVQKHVLTNSDALLAGTAVSFLVGGAGDTDLP